MTSDGGAGEGGPRRRYVQGRDGAREAAAEARKRSERLTLARGAVFVGIGASLVLADPLDGAGEPVAVAAGLLLLVLFLWLVRVHRRIRREIRGHELRERLHRAGIARLDRAWDELDELGLPATAGTEVPEDHPYAPDLHLFGHASLFRLAGPVTTPPGRRTLAGWLVAPAAPEDVARRQGAVRTLAGEVEWRHGLAVRGIPEGRGGGGRSEEPGADEPDRVRALTAWATDPSWLAGERAVRVAAAVLPPATVALFAAWLAAGIPPWWIVPLLLQIVALRRVQGRIGDDVDRAAVGAAAAGRFAAQLRWMEDTPHDGDLLDEVRRTVSGGPGGTPAHRALAALGSRLDFAESRRNMIYEALNYLVLLDVWVYRSLERWKEAHGSRVGEWLDALGRVEALSALGTLAWDHPDWCFPRVGERGDGDGPEIRARALGHPLIAPSARVSNDVRVGPPGTFLFVTGSNMSGKSTFLRAIGANVVLAQAGAPVCADALSMPPLSVWTSMMVGDSLEDGVSRFMAELLRLKAVVDAAEGAEPSRPVLFLLDEILQGTNTAERRVAARTAIRRLLDAGAVGAVTSHDITLHQAPDLERRTRPFHFRESVERVDGRPRLHFDYQLRPGLSTTTNALELLEAVGLGRPRETERLDPPDRPDSTP